MVDDVYLRAVRLAKALQLDLVERLDCAFRELGDSYLVRARVVGARIKSQASLDRKAKSNEWAPGQAVERAEDFLGLRIVCNNLQDVHRAAELVTGALEATKIKVTRKDYIQAPKGSGYRAIHLLLKNELRIGSDAMTIGCEIQIRTLAQDVWGHLSHEDIYKGTASRRLIDKTRRLSDILSRADRVAEEIRREVVRPRKGRKPSAGAVLNRSSIAFLYHRAFGEYAPDYVVESILREFGDAKFRADGLDQSLQDKELLGKVSDSYAAQTRWGPGPEQVFRWAVIASINGVGAASREAAREGRQDWKEIDRQFKSELSSSVPKDLDELRRTLRAAEDDGDPEWDAYQWAEYFDAARRCEFCGAHLVEIDTLAERLVKHFRLRSKRAEELYEKIQELLLKAGIEDANGDRQVPFVQGHNEVARQAVVQGIEKAL
jgi:ppGpp synthetase/RelA/SpoT-type nucleotidyltranferase